MIGMADALRPRYPIRTERLLLRPLTPADTDALLAYRSRADVCRYLPFEPMTPEVVAARLAGDWARHELTDEGQAITLGIESTDGGELVGDLVLFWRSRAHAGGEIGWVLHPEHTNRGYATEAATALLDLAFGDLGLHRVVARLDERNEPSARLARRLGMREEARLVENELFKGEWSTELDFAILAAEGRARSPHPA
jgi:RimJ/RimL family protein N-acetyltransferase